MQHLFISNGTPFLELEQQMGGGKKEYLKARDIRRAFVWLWEYTHDHAHKKIGFQRIMQMAVQLNG